MTGFLLVKKWWVFQKKPSHFAKHFWAFFNRNEYSVPSVESNVNCFIRYFCLEKIVRIFFTILFGTIELTQRNLRAFLLSVIESNWNNSPILNGG